jgi:predicted GNAT family N-acyltransferase
MPHNQLPDANACATVDAEKEAVVTTVGPVEAARTYRLRQAVLRPHQRVEDLAAADTGEGTCLAAWDDATGEILSTLTYYREAPPEILRQECADAPSYRLRAVATAPAHRRQGLAKAVLADAVARIGELGGGFVWCNARLGAKDFYSDAGFVAVGPVFEEPEIGPHVVMWRRVEA